MIDVKTAGYLAEYNGWANQTLFAAMRKLPESALYKETRSIFKSMVGTLNHNYQVDLIWQAHLHGKDHGFKSRRDVLHARFEDLVRAQTEADLWFSDWIRQQTPDSLSEWVDFKFTSGEPARMQKGVMFLHVVNHKTYHRGWVSEMFFDFGVEPPQTDLSVYATQPGR